MNQSLSLAALASLAALGLAACASNPPQTASSAPAQSAASRKQVCIDTYRIDHTQVVDDRTILFHMVDHSIWKNTLSFPCPDLKFQGGFLYSTDIDEICSNLQTIRVIEQGGGPLLGAVCQLGEFTPYPPPKPVGG